MSRRRARPIALAALFGDVVAHGWGLPLIAGLISLVVSYLGAWALIGHGVPAGEEWRYPAAALVFLAQWAANVCLLRARRAEGADRTNFLRAWACCALVAAGGLFHAFDEIRAASHDVAVSARAAERETLVARLAAADAAVERAQSALASITATAEANSWPAARIERASAPHESVLGGENGALARAARAEAALERRPPLPPTRAYDLLDILALAVAGVIAILERVFYWSMLAQAAPRAPRDAVVAAPAPANIDTLIEQDHTGVLVGLARHRIMRAAALGAGMMLAPTAAQAGQGHQPDAIMAGQKTTLADPPPSPGRPSPEEVADALLMQGKPRRVVMLETGLKRWQVDARAAALGLVKAAQ